MTHVRKGLPFFVPILTLLAALYFFLPFSSESSSPAEIEALAPVELVAERFKDPTGIAVDQNGAIFVSDRKAGEVFRINSQIESVVGGLKRPVGLDFDAGGRLLIVEEGAGRLLRLESGGSLAVVAQGMKRPRWVTVAEDGTLYISAKGLKSVKDKDEDDEDEEHGEAILRLTTQGELTALVDGFKGLQGVIVHENNLFAAAKGLKEGSRQEEKRGGVFKISVLADGNAGPISRLTQTDLKKPFGLVRGFLGAFYVTAEELLLPTKVKDAIGKVAPDGALTRFASKLEKPRGLALDHLGNLYLADDNGGKKGRIIRFRAPPPPTINIPAFTKQNPLAVSGVSEPNSRIDAFLNDSVTPAIFTQDGTFALILDLIPNTQNLLSVFTTAHNGQGLTSAAAAFTIIHDNIAPLISNLQPANGSFLNNSRPLIRADFSDNLSGVDVARVEIRLNSFDVTANASVTASGFTLDFLNCLNVLNCPLTQGQHTVSVTVFDRAGNSATASTTFTVDVTAPLIVNLTPANGSVVSTASPLISAQFQDTFGINLTSVRILLDGVDRTAQASVSATGFTLDLLNCLNPLNCLNLSQGPHTVSVTLSDLAGNPASASSTFTISLGPQLAPIGNKTVNLGETLTFTVSGNSTSGTPSLFVSPLPLPNHASFNAVTGEFRFTPDTTQVGSFQLTFSAVSGTQSAAETITITVPQPPPNGITALRGRVYNLNNTPLGNVKVTLKATGHTAFSGADGFFTLTGLPPGRQELIINGREANLGVFAILAVPVNLIEGVLNNLPSIITIPDVDVQAEVPVNAVFTTFVSNPSVPGVELEIHGGTAKNSDGTTFTGKLSINPVPDYGRPESRPEELRPGMAITIQPAGIRFNPPARLTFPNADGMAAGSELNLWSLSPDTGTFNLVGKGVVSQDGLSIVTTEGGVSASAWHFFLAPSGSSNTDVDESPGLSNYPDKECLGTAGSTVALQNGCLGVNFALPSYRSLGVSRPVKFIYKSNRANPQPVIPFNATIPVRAAVPPKLSYSLSVGGVEQGIETFINTSGLDENRDETIRAVTSFDTSQLKSGIYPYRIKLTNNYLNSAISSFISDRVLVVNEVKSAFGAGWGVEGLGRLHFNADGSVVFTEGNGTALFFSGGPNVFSSPPGDFSTLIRNLDGTFTRTLKDGTKIHFNAQGLQTSVGDRNGNSTTYSYDASGKLISIADPARLVTTFTYTGNLFSSVTDPAGKKTTFTHDAQGNLTRVTFANGSFKSFGYDSKHLMAIETDERGLTVQREYDGVGRLIKATLPDGSIRSATNAQSVGFVDPSSGLGTIINPAPVVRPADALSRFTDGQGNQQVVKIGKFGAPQRITDALGQTIVIERRAGNDVTLFSGATFAQGQLGQGFLFDGADDFGQTARQPLNPNAGTVEFWLRPDTVGRFMNLFYVGNDDGFTEGGGGNVQEFSIEIQRDSNQLQWSWQGGIFDQLGFNTIVGIGSGVAVVPGQFFHVALTYDRSSVAHLYVNGAFKGEVSFAGKTINTNLWPNFALFGANNRLKTGQGTITQRYQGLIDEVRVYSRPLSAEEIRSIFIDGNAGNRSTPPSGLVSWWPGDGDATDIANAHGLPTKIIRPNGAVVTMSYNSKGDLLTSTDPVGATTTFTYEPSFNQVTSIRDPKGSTTTISYDAKGNPTEIRDSQGNVTQMSYETRGLLTSVTDPQAKTTSFSYDLKGNLITTTDPLGQLTTLQYDQAGNVIKSTDSEGRVTEFTYDSFNRLVSVRDFAGDVTTYAYDQKGNLAQVIDASGQNTSFSYDALDRLASSTNPQGLTESFSYDANGNLTSTAHRNAQTISFDYDALNRLIKKTLPGNQVTTFSYDSVGNLTSVIDPDSAVTMAYDLANRLTSTTASSLSVPAKTIAYQYDLNGNRTRMTDPQGGVSSYAYDSLNRLTSVTNPSAKTTSFAYDNLGRRTSMTHANGAVTSYTYDAASQLLSLVHQLGATTINSFSYTYDRVGNRKSKADNNGTANYTYDTLNRLVQAVNPLPSNPLESFTYDAVGNRTNSNQNGASTFNQANQLLEDSNFTYQYDNNGNLTRKTSKTGGPFTSYEYDAENKLVRAVVNGTTANYKYDGLGRRVEKEVISVSTTVTRYIYDNEDILLDLDGSNNITARYTHGPGIDEPLAMERGGQSFFYHADGLGSITEITDGAGVIKQRYTYSSFGKIESQLDASFVQPYTFTSREFDPETGLYYYRARYYDSTTGRFIQQDPLGFAAGDVNLYRYVASNPINFVDPSGKLLPLVVIIPVVAGVVNGAVSAATASQACDATPLKILQAFGNGAVGGIVGSLVGLGIGAATGNPILGGAAGGLTSNLVEQALGGQGLDAISATAATIGGGIGGDAARRLLPLAGRTPYLTPLRTNYGPNSYRMMGQEAINESVEGAVGAVVGGAANAISGSGSKGCGC